MVEKIIIAILDIPIKILRGNYKLFERNVWPEKTEQSSKITAIDSKKERQDKIGRPLPY